MKRFFVIAASLALSLSLGLLAGCGASSTVSTAPLAYITSFAATPADITAGSSSSLTPVFGNGTGAITPGNIAVTSGTAVSVTPAATTTYTLTVTPTSGVAATQTVTVTVSAVVATPSITSFTASPATIAAGASSQLTPVFTNGTGIITPGNIAVTSGTAVSVTPAVNTTYTLTVTNSASVSVSQTATVTVVPAPAITSFAASPTTIEAGSNSQLTAVFTGGTGVITPGSIAVSSGTAVTVTPSATQIYTLTVTPTSGSAITQTLTVTVDPVPVISGFTANPTAITVGASSQLTATFTGGTGVITPGSISVSSGTAVTVTPSATQIYTLTVTPPAGAAITQTATVTVNPAGASITSFTANPTTITAGGSTQLTPVFTGGTGVITPGSISVSSGTAVTVTPSATQIYTLTVTPTTGTAITQTVTVPVNPAGASITSFTANPATITAGGSTQLTPVFTGGTGKIVPGNITVVSGTAYTVSPTVNTIYTLTVTPSVGQPIQKTVLVTVTPIDGITSFTANPATITAGGSTQITPVFYGGTGKITPGNITATSGTAYTFSPTVNTTYTLTVTPAVGAPIQKTVLVTVTPIDGITSFTANPAAISAGQSTQLTAVFYGGTGKIVPGSISVTSGTPVTVSPTVTTTYTLTVTPAVGVPLQQTVVVTIVVTSSITVTTPSTTLAVTDQLLGMNLASWYDVASTSNAPNLKNAFQTAGIKAVRWPGGSWSDAYNWETNTECGSYANTSDTFANFVTNLVIPTGLDVALTADYGTGKNCTGAGDPTEAAAWAAEALKLGITVSHMTVGNEEYGSWEVDNHAFEHDPSTYAAAVAGSSGFYDLIKAASSKTLVGVDVSPGDNWDSTVLANASGYYDFVEYHYYPETPGQESDSFLVNSGAKNLTTTINTVKSELTAAGNPNTPIYVGEIGGPYSNPGKQSWSITQGLYAGQVLGEMMNDGVSRLTWWIGFGNCNGTAGNNSASLYGWQDFGAYNVFSDGSSDGSCPNAGPIGTMSPTARAFQLFSHIAIDGESVLTTNVTGDPTDVVAYAATHSGGTALAVFNRNETISEPIEITVTGKSTASSVTVITYDKAIYDLSGSPTGVFPDPLGTSTWADPSTTTISSPTLPLSLTLTPWSMNIIIIQ